MPSKFSALAFLLFCSLRAFALELGAPAPDFQLSGLKQESVTLSKLKGKVVYLDFWASWCGPCRKSFPWMNEMKRKYAADGLEIVAVNLDQKRTDVEKFLTRLQADFTVVLDAASVSAKAFELKGMPSSVIVDRGGIVRAIHTGFTDAEKPTREAEIKKALESK